MQLIWRNFSEFSLEDLYRLLKLRQDVFILEQQSLYADLDHKDQTARHLLAQEKGLLVGALRLSVEEGEPVMISRVVVAKVARGKGVGMDLMRAALEETEKQWQHWRSSSARRKFRSLFMSDSDLLSKDPPIMMAASSIATCGGVADRSGKTLASHCVNWQNTETFDANPARATAGWFCSHTRKERRGHQRQGLFVLAGNFC